MVRVRARQVNSMLYRCLRPVHQANVWIQILYQDDASFVAELEARGQPIEMCLLHLDARFVTDTFMGRCQRREWVAYVLSPRSGSACGYSIRSCLPDYARSRGDSP